jgi:hypothetical protein
MLQRLRGEELSAPYSLAEAYLHNITPGLQQQRNLTPKHQPERRTIDWSGMRPYRATETPLKRAECPVFSGRTVFIIPGLPEPREFTPKHQPGHWTIDQPGMRALPCYRDSAEKSCAEKSCAEKN